MAWEDDATEILRMLTDDYGTTSRVSDDNLLRALLVAAFQVNREVDFDTAYSINLTAQSISPSPSADEAFLNLMTLKAACMLDRGAAITAANRAIAVRDGSSSVDLRGIAKARLEIAQKGGYCKAYQEAREDFIREQAGIDRTGATTAGRAVLSPFRTLARQLSVIDPPPEE